MKLGIQYRFIVVNRNSGRQSEISYRHPKHEIITWLYSRVGQKSKWSKSFYFYVELNSKHILFNSFYPKNAFLVAKNALLCLHWFLTNIQRKIFPNFKCIFSNYRCIFLENVT